MNLIRSILSIKGFFFALLLLICSHQSTAIAAEADDNSVLSVFDIIRDVVSQANKLRTQGISFQLNEREFAETGQHSAIEVTNSGQQIKINFSFDRASLDKPELLLSDLVLLSAITSVGRQGTGSVLQFDPILTSKLGSAANFIFPKSGFRFAANWVEVLRNVQLGSLSAKLALTSVRQLALEALVISPDLEAKLIKIGLSRDRVNEVLQFSRSQRLILQEKMKIITESNEISLARRRLQAAPNQSTILRELVVRNDRKGVANLFRTNLPWEIMEPTEKETWNKWIDAIENPDFKNSMLLFRGVGKQNKTLSNGTSWAFTANTLNGSGAILDLFIHSRRKNGNVFKDLGIEASTISQQMKRHAFSSNDSNFLSFTSDFILATGFVGTESEKTADGRQGFLATRIDSRRLLPNFTSEINEKEYLVPLIVFPDEVVFFKEVSFHDRHRLKEKDFMETAAAEILEKSGSDKKQAFSVDESDLSDKFEIDVEKSVLSLFGEVKRATYINTIKSCRSIFQ